jgi:endonuclease-3
MTRLARATDGLTVPTVEQVARDRPDDPFRVLIATMLSAQTRDAVTEAACRRLLRVAGTPQAMAELPVGRIERLIYPVSFYRQKARSVRRTCRLLVERHGGSVPTTLEALLALPGVGRKTATLVLIAGYRRTDYICVDTHVHRIANRLGWVSTRTPAQTERALYRLVPRRFWPRVNLYLVTWGQHVCRPVYPRCGTCVLADLCPRVGVGRPRAVPPTAESGRARAGPR